MDRSAGGRHRFPPQEPPDYARCQRITEKLGRLWEKNYADWRLGQFLVNITRFEKGPTKDVFYLEDDVLEAVLDRELEAKG